MFFTYKIMYPCLYLTLTEWMDASKKAGLSNKYFVSQACSGKLWFSSLGCSKDTSLWELHKQTKHTQTVWHSSSCLHLYSVGTWCKSWSLY